MKKKEKLKTLRSLSKTDQLEKLKSLKEELLGLRFKHSARTLDNTAQLKNIRKDIAISYTLLNSSEK